jgi:1,2-diacylglycerol 3-beta-glucosyltransferase
VLGLDPEKMIGCWLLVPAAPVLAAAGYLGLLAGIARPRSQDLSAPPRTRFDVIVPAHNEEQGISRTVRSLLSVDYPEQLYRVTVLADNCTDGTAARARRAGANVLSRDDPDHQGKGYALRHAFEWSLDEGFSDAVVVVDADTSVSQTLLRALDAKIQKGAHAAQAEYAVRNPSASWRTRLMALALSTHHRLRNLARERMGVSIGLHGNGMAFTHHLLRQVPYEAFSIVEDLEYGIRLGYAGHRVHYAAGATVYGDMVASEPASRSQRWRWERGRLAMAKRHVLPLLATGLRRRDKVLLDLAMELAVPPLTYVAAAAAAGLLASVGSVLLLRVGWAAVLPWVGATSLISCYVLRGIALSGRGPRAILDLAWAPAYVIWKMRLMARTRARQAAEWIRTERNR